VLEELDDDIPMNIRISIEDDGSCEITEINEVNKSPENERKIQ
jgi:hypothetical protein